MNRWRCELMDGTLRTPTEPVIIEGERFPEKYCVEFIPQQDCHASHIRITLEGTEYYLDVAVCKDLHRLICRAKERLVAQGPSKIDVTIQGRHLKTWTFDEYFAGMVSDNA